MLQLKFKINYIAKLLLQTHEFCLFRNSVLAFEGIFVSIGCPDGCPSVPSNIPAWRTVRVRSVLDVVQSN